MSPDWNLLPREYWHAFLLSLRSFVAIGHSSRRPNKKCTACSACGARSGKEKSLQRSGGKLSFNFAFLVSYTFHAWPVETSARPLLPSSVMLTFSGESWEGFQALQSRRNPPAVPATHFFSGQILCGGTLTGRNKLKSLYGMCPSRSFFGQLKLLICTCLGLSVRFVHLFKAPRSTYSCSAQRLHIMGTRRAVCVCVCVWGLDIAHVRHNARINEVLAFVSFVLHDFWGGVHQIICQNSPPPKFQRHSEVPPFEMRDHGWMKKAGLASKDKINGEGIGQCTTSFFLSSKNNTCEAFSCS